MSYDLMIKLQGCQGYLLLLNLDNVILLKQWMQEWIQQDKKQIRE